MTNDRIQNSKSAGGVGVVEKGYVRDGYGSHYWLPLLSILPFCHWAVASLPLVRRRSIHFASGPMVARARNAGAALNATGNGHP